MEKDSTNDEEVAQENVCGEVHPLPCGVDKACPDTEGEA